MHWFRRHNKPNRPLRQSRRPSYPPVDVITDDKQYRIHFPLDGERNIFGCRKRPLVTPVHQSPMSVNPPMFAYHPPATYQYNMNVTTPSPIYYISHSSPTSSASSSPPPTYKPDPRDLGFEFSAPWPSNHPTTQSHKRNKEAKAKLKKANDEAEEAAKAYQNAILGIRPTPAAPDLLATPDGRQIQMAPPVRYIYHSPNFNAQYPTVHDQPSKFIYDRVSKPRRVKYDMWAESVNVIPYKTFDNSLSLRAVCNALKINPILVHRVGELYPLVYNVGWRTLHIATRDDPLDPWAGAAALRAQAATLPKVTYLSLVSPFTPKWPIEVVNDDGVTVGDVLDKIYMSFREFVTHDEWAREESGIREQIDKAGMRNSAHHEYWSSPDTPFSGSIRKIRRVDYLLSACYFDGLVNRRRHQDEYGDGDVCRLEMRFTGPHGW